MRAHPALRLAVPALDAFSRRWLRRSRLDPYAGEVLAIAQRMGGGGVCALNLIYDWACTTAVALGEGPPRMLRLLDWGLPGIGGHSVILRHQAPAGNWLAITWPGLVGVFTALAPGRFAIAINQPPESDPLRRLGLMLGGDGLPAGHLVRQVCENAPDFATAVAMLAEAGRRLLSPAIFTVAGIGEGEGRVIEARGRQRRLHDAANHGGCLAVANAWLSDWPGRPRAFAAASGEDARANNVHRCQQVAAALARPDWEVAALSPPALNPKTVQILAMTPAAGRLTARAVEGGAVVLGPTAIGG